VLALAAALMLGILIWGLAGILVSSGAGPRPQSISEYGFSLANPIIPLDLVAIGSEPGVIHALDGPNMIPAGEVDEINHRERGSYLVDDDQIVGIEINGDVRAYPIRILQWHEVVNDTVGGRPVAVTYNGLCDSAVVFDRTLDDETIAFDVSGLLYNSNLLMYDRRRDGGQGGESLWSQIGGRAVTGTASGLELSILPCAVVSWSQWRQKHPDTIVLAPNPHPQRERFYDRDAYGSYQSSDVLKFPVRPLPPRDGRALKERIIAVLPPGAAAQVFSIDELVQRGNGGAVELDMGNTMLIAEVFEEPPAVIVRDAAGEPLPVIYSYWFSWYSISMAGER
jgi:hypothetical protein